ncbi:unnamed protein product [Diplocarpon coronariae]
MVSGTGTTESKTTPEEIQPAASETNQLYLSDVRVSQRG